MAKSKKMNLISDKFPYLKFVKNKVSSRQKLIDINNKIKSELPRLISDANDPYEKAKYQKELIQIDMEQSKHHKQLAEDEHFLKIFREKMKSGIEQANNDYDEVVASARKQILSNEKIAQKFKDYQQFDLKENWEAKVSFYLELKELLSK